MWECETKDKSKVTKGWIQDAPKDEHPGGARHFGEVRLRGRSQSAPLGTGQIFSNEFEEITSAFLSSTFLRLEHPRLRLTPCNRIR
jgi:hypothetical protein